MHAFHSLAHRAPPATRTRVRWQPYTSIPPSCSSSSSRSSPASYLNTPASSVTSSPQISSLTTELDRIRPNPPSTSKDLPTKDTTRNKYITGLVDQAVKSLSEIWRPQDIPPVFMTSTHAMVTGGGAYEASLVLDPKPPTRNHYRNQQLPSPISPSTRSLPSLPASSPSLSANTTLSTSESDIASMSGPNSNLVPIKSFVHEVLRRSRTSGCVLQTALCYLEAIRSRVPELVRREQAGEGVQGELDRSDWITPATAEELEREAEFSLVSDPGLDNPTIVDDNLIATVRVNDNADSFNKSFEYTRDGEQELLGLQRTPTGPTLPPLPPLPSPLLCPRRAFLASLILASKFTQDKCYSNRAWAKLSGLPPREIGRCERALGEALDWRLWVGKQPVAAPPSPSLPAQNPVPRSLARSQSESCLSPTNSGPFLVRAEPPIISAMTGVLDNRGLRRHSTLPADVFGQSGSYQPPLEVPWSTSMPGQPPDDQMDSSSQLTSIEPHIVMASPWFQSTAVLSAHGFLSSQGNDLVPSSSAYCQYPDKINQSPSPQTPSLTYSPSSTESCSGDHTIQMASFLDDSTGHTICSETWPWLDTTDGVHCDLANRKIISALGGALDSTPSGIDFGGRSPFKLSSDVDSAPLCTWVSAPAIGSTADPLHW